MSQQENILHMATELWDGSAYVLSLCGQEISCLEASILYTNCPNCKKNILENARQANLDQLLKSESKD